MLGGLALAPLLSAAAGGESAVGAGAEENMLRLLYQLFVVLLATRALAEASATRG